MESNVHDYRVENRIFSICSESLFYLDFLVKGQNFQLADSKNSSTKHDSSAYITPQDGIKESFFSLKCHLSIQIIVHSVCRYKNTVGAGETQTLPTSGAIKDLPTLP